MNLLHRISIACAGIAPALTPVAAFAVTGSFTQYVSSVVQSGMLDQVFVYSTAAIGGVLMHYLKSWMDQRTDASLWQYLVKQFPGRTALMVLAQIAAGAAMGFSGAWDVMTWPVLIMNAFTTGFAIDSMTNKACPADPTSLEATAHRTLEGAPA